MSDKSIAGLKNIKSCIAWLYNPIGVRHHVSTVIINKDSRQTVCRAMVVPQKSTIWKVSEPLGMSVATISPTPFCD